eukprot:11159153-Lingulodinium_polyedra.AAC.1
MHRPTSGTASLRSCASAAYSLRSPSQPFSGWMAGPSNGVFGVVNRGKVGPIGKRVLRFIVNFTASNVFQEP